MIPLTGNAYYCIVDNLEPKWSAWKVHDINSIAHQSTIYLPQAGVERQLVSKHSSATSLPQEQTQILLYYIAKSRAESMRRTYPGPP